MSQGLSLERGSSGRARVRRNGHVQGQSLGHGLFGRGSSGRIVDGAHACVPSYRASARSLRSLPPAGVYHVTARGVARQPISVDDHDRERFVTLVNAARRQNDWQLLAYCLMPNHFHLVVLCALERLTRGMHFLNFRYAQRFNERHDRVGHLFQDRFGARAVEGDEHFRERRRVRARQRRARGPLRDA